METVAVWATTADGKLLLERLPDLQPARGSQSPLVSLFIDESSEGQEIDGFGASLTESSAWLIRNKMNDEQKRKLLSTLFDPENGIGLSMIRHPMGASDFALAEYTYDDVPPGQEDPALASFSIARDTLWILPTLKEIRALQPELKIVASPWSAPAWMKTGGALSGGELRDPQGYAPFARYFVKFLEAYKTEGVPVHAITIQNEPQHESDYPSMRMEWWHQANFVRYHLGPALASAGLQPKIWILDHNWDLADFAHRILADHPEVANLVSGTAFHCYAGNPEAMADLLAQHPDKEIHLTECSSGTWSGSLGDQMDWEASRLFIGPLSKGTRSVLKWNLALDDNHGPVLPGKSGVCSNCNGLVTIHDDGTFEPTNDFYIMAHASKFIRPGARRIGTALITEQEATSLQSVAFRNKDGTRVVLLRNAGSSPVQLQLKPGAPGDSSSFFGEIPPNSLVSLRW